LSYSFGKINYKNKQSRVWILPNYLAHQKLILSTLKKMVMQLAPLNGITDNVINNLQGNQT
jgi:hypothetical protein